MYGFNLVGSDAIHRVADVHVIKICIIQSDGSINGGVGRQNHQAFIVLLKANIISHSQLVQLLGYVLHFFIYLDRGRFLPLFLDNNSVAMVLSIDRTTGTFIGTVGTRSCFE